MTETDPVVTVWTLDASSQRRTVAELATEYRQLDKAERDLETVRKRVEKQAQRLANDMAHLDARLEEVVSSAQKAAVASDKLSTSMAGVEVPAKAAGEGGSRSMDAFGKAVGKANLRAMLTMQQ